MSWWGKVLGGAFGFMLGGPLGALLGAVLGHNLDLGLARLPEGELGEGEKERVQAAFFTATFSVMGHIAKADGRVSEDEIEMARAVMRQMELDEKMRRAAIDLFTQGKSPDFQLDPVLDQFRRECRGRSTLIRLFIEIQLQASFADGHLDEAEDKLLRHICRKLRFPQSQYERLEEMIRAELHQGRQSGGAQRPTLPDAYALLNVEPEASDQEVKRAYRRLLSQHHPDKLVAKGLPEEMMKVAAQKTHEIRQAYERIKKERGF
jgi:DnaJ like chaperone protein